MTAVRTWVPTDYVDEVTPPARETPSAWIERLDDGAPVLGVCDELNDEEKRRLLDDGDVVNFDWIDRFESVEFTVRADGTWSVDPPPAPEAKQFSAVGDPESACDGLEAFAQAWIDNDPDPTTETLNCYRWSPRSVPHVYRDGAFHPVEAQP